jgi:uncharacterized HAD superfamily protein
VHNIIFVTARKENAQISTLKWFDYHGFDISLAQDICFSSHDKAKTCFKKKIDLMIEDCPYHLNSLSAKGIPTLKVNHLYNKNIESDFQANDWKEIYDIIEEVNNLG